MINFSFDFQLYQWYSFYFSQFYFLASKLPVPVLNKNFDKMYDLIQHVYSLATVVTFPPEKQKIHVPVPTIVTSNCK